MKFVLIGIIIWISLIFMSLGIGIVFNMAGDTISSIDDFIELIIDSIILSSCIPIVLIVVTICVFVVSLILKS